MKRWLAVIFFVLLLAAKGNAGWQQISALPGGGFASCCFFIDENNGLAGSGDLNRFLALKIWRTANGGVSWIEASTPGGQGQVTSIFMVDQLTGYASVFSQANLSISIWKTVDGGYSWIDFTKSTSGFTTSVWATPKALIKTMWSGSPGGRSIDGGTTFDQRFSGASTDKNNSNGIYFSNDSIGVVTAGPSVGHSWYTTDGGVTWTNAGIQGEAWSAYAIKNTKVFFVCPELDGQKRVYWSLDGGKTWSPRASLVPAMNGSNFAPTGHIHGYGNYIYTQSTANNIGLMRASLSDSGATWRAVGGPCNNLDSRAFWVSGCQGEVVIAFDTSGNVWRTSDGGDGTLTTNSNLTYQHITFPQISSCSKGQKTSTVENSTCGDLIVNTITLQNSAGVYFFTPPSLPDTISEGDTRTYTVDFIPGGNPGTFNAQLRLQGFLALPGGKRVLDTLIQIIGTALAEPPKFASNVSVLDFGGVGICRQSKDSSFTFTNKGCDTLEIVSGPGALAPEFMIDPISLPYLLPPDSSVTIRAHFTPLTLGVKTSNPNYSASMQGRTTSLEIQMSGTGLDGESVLDYAPKAIGFDTISICGSPDSADGFITNLGCVPMTVENFALAGDAAFALVSGSLIGQDIQPRDSLHYRIIFTPIAKGSHGAQLAIRTKNKSGTGASTDAAVSIDGNVNDGTKLLAVAPPSIDFGTTTLCEEKNGTVTVTNTGCDTVIVTDALLAGLGFQISGFVSPTILPPGGSLSVTIDTKVDTTGGATTNSGSLTFKSSAQNVLSAVTFTRSIRLPGKVGIELAAGSLAAGDTGTAGDIVSFIIRETTGMEFAGSGVKTLDFDLLYNTDLLGYIRPQGPNSVVSNDGKHFTFSNTPEIKADGNGNLAELTFQIYLTRDSSTTLALANPVASDGGTQGQCAATAVASGSASFTYTYLCADHFLQSYIRGEKLPVRIVSLSPNPAKDEIVAEVFAAESGVTNVEIYDALGKRLAGKEEVLIKGKQKITLDVASLPAGMYSVRIGNTSGRFLKVK